MQTARRIDAEKIEIKRLSSSPEICTALCELHIEGVASGASLSYMHPLKSEIAKAFWDDALVRADRGERIILGAWDGDVLAGTVTLLLNIQQNQPHRGEIAKLITRASHRGHGIATALLGMAEELAIKHGCTILILNTVTDGGASGLYEGLGYILSGTVPDYALTPYGKLTGSMRYWKRI